MSTTLDKDVAYRYAGGSKGCYHPRDPYGHGRPRRRRLVAQPIPGEQEILFAPLTGLEVVGKRVVGGIIVVEVRLNVNLMALTIEQVIAKMQRSHIQMLDTMIDRQKQDLTEDEVGPLLALKDKAEARDGEWFNSPDKFEEATNKAMEAQREIVIEGVKNSRLARHRCEPAALGGQLRGQVEQTDARHHAVQGGRVDLRADGGRGPLG